MRSEISRQMKKKIATAIHDIRKEKGLTQAEVNQKGELWTNACSVVEVGKGYSLDVLNKLCGALDTTLHDLSQRIGANGTLTELHELNGEPRPKRKRQASTTTGRSVHVGRASNNDWSITMGDWKLTLSGIGEPEAVLLEKI